MRGQSIQRVRGQPCDLHDGRRTWLYGDTQGPQGCSGRGGPRLIALARDTGGRTRPRDKSRTARVLIAYLV